MSSRLLHFIMLTLCIAGISFAQNINIKHIKSEQKDFPTIVSSLQVQDRNLDPVEDLKSNELTITVDGTSSTINSLQTYKQSQLGLNIMLCVDVSKTMAGKPMESMKDAILRFIDEMRAQDKLGIIAYGDNAEVLADFSGDKNFLRRIVNGISATGSRTELNYGAYQGAKKLADNVENVGKILIVIGDGKDESQSKTYSTDDVIAKAKDAGVPIFTIGYSKVEQAYLQNLQRMSDQTGGTYYESPTEDQLERSYKKLYNQVLNIYLAAFSSPKDGDGLEHVLSFTINRNNETKATATKVIFPAGKKGMVPTSSSSSETNWLLYGGIAGGVLLLVVAGVFVKKRSDKKREEEEQEKRALEEKHRQELEAERIKQEQLKKELEEKNKPKETQPAATNIPQGEKTVLVGGGASANPDRTVIINSSNASIKTLSITFQVGGDSGKTVSVAGHDALIGRKDGNTIVLSERTVSGTHARISFDQYGYSIENLSTNNGTFVNGQMIAGRVLLNNGDAVKFGADEGYITIY